MEYLLFREQQLSCDVDTAWDFFSNPHNLTNITPENIQFEVLSRDLQETIYEGMQIDYRVVPIFGVPMRWRTLIKDVDTKKSFVDIQERGPYKKWEHTHQFIPNSDGVLIKDSVRYILPMGILGRLVHALFVKRKLKEIFDYRYQVLEAVFNSRQ
ncbi:Ligand-binding SRPBCC domain-containing protein [Sphingobacterium nematocida]|uniref:Ligand-binding SRPBCC domain-containing protein n=1 Tax=Sphingobacterium nematocida TaxID=1513896 RepID=A0A1T5AVV2_9SPHI|nr:SRPBCC family protein [Sphingobacterium nematocida]SKB38939.1 Ligand-binding SRPBCC domain-containing protein [Sphingobacterium nematocida]